MLSPYQAILKQILPLSSEIITFFCLLEEINSLKPLLVTPWMALPSVSCNLTAFALLLGESTYCLTGRHSAMNISTGGNGNSEVVAPEHILPFPLTKEESCALALPSSHRHSICL